MDGDENRERVLDLHERWDRADRLEAVRDRLFGVAATAVVLVALLAAVPDRGTVTPLVVGLAQAVGAGIALAAYTVRTALGDPEALREATFEDEFLVALGTYALGSLSAAARGGGPALAAWRLLFQETPGDAERRDGWGRPDRDDAWQRWVAGGAVLLSGVVVLEQVSAVVGIDSLIGLLAGAGSGAPTLPAGGVSLPELGPVGTVALFVGAVVLGAVIGLALALARA
jgi:hypothetical protein